MSVVARVNTFLERVMTPEQREIANPKFGTRSSSPPFWDKAYTMCGCGKRTFYAHWTLPTFYILWLGSAFFYPRGDLGEWLAIFAVASLCHFLSIVLSELLRANLVDRAGTKLSNIVLCPFGIADNLNSEFGFTTFQEQTRVWLLGLVSYAFMGGFWCLLQLSTGRFEWGVKYPVGNDVDRNIFNVSNMTMFHVCLLNATVPVFPFGLAQVVVSHLVIEDYAAERIGGIITSTASGFAVLWFIVGCISRSFILIFASFWAVFQVYLLYQILNDDKFHRHTLYVDAGPNRIKKPKKKKVKKPKERSDSKDAGSDDEVESTEQTTGGVSYHL